MTPGPRSPRAALPRAVVLLGLTSLFTDVASDMIMPLLPLLLAQMRTSPGTMLGLIEGAAEATASFLKLGSGWLADRTARRKPIVVAGYGIAAIVRPLIALASSPLHVLVVRVIDRVGKGIRTAPRDVMIAAAAAPGEAGRAFGFHRAMDHAGAVIGPLIATALLALGWQLRDVFWAAAIPGALGVACLLLVREPASAPVTVAAPEVAVPPVPSALRGYLGILAIFALGNPSDTFLILRAQDVGVADTAIPILWGVLHVAKVAATWLGGDLADRVSRPRLIAVGWLVNAASFLALGFADEAWQLWAIVIVYGAYHALTEPAEKALVRDLAPEHARGRAYGLYHFVIGITAIPAGLTMGALWDHQGPVVAFGVGAALAALSSIALGLSSTRMTRPG